MRIFRTDLSRFSEDVANRRIENPPSPPANVFSCDWYKSEITIWPFIPQDRLLRGYAVEISSNYARFYSKMVARARVLTSLHVQSRGETPLYRVLKNGSPSANLFSCTTENVGASADRRDRPPSPSPLKIDARWRRVCSPSVSIDI